MPELNQFARVHLAHLPTPIDALPRLSQVLNGVDVFVKRDDCTGLGGGGNKARKLEYLFAEARSAGADVVITAGALQSNHARQTAAAAARLGLRCRLVLTSLAQPQSAEYENNGNFLLDELFGAQITLVGDAPSGPVMEELAAGEREAGATPYIIPIGGSNELGSLGYVNAWLELLQQCASAPKFDVIVLATGSAGTQAGLIAGQMLTGHNIPIMGYTVGATEAAQKAKVTALLKRILELLGLPAADCEARVQVNAQHAGPGYGQPGPSTLRTVRALAKSEGLLLDPVYTGKAMDGLCEDALAGRFRRGTRVLFWHTGGAAALHGYSKAFNFGDSV